jgi:spermidine/putrescine-binding protein
MKKTMICLILAAAFTGLLGCGVAMTALSAGSAIYSGNECEAAEVEVSRYFRNFEGCTMKEIHYAGDEAVKAEAKSLGMEADQVMVLESTFTTDSENHKNGLEPDSTYNNYRWILTRETRDGRWEHKDHGYG